MYSADDMRTPRDRVDEEFIRRLLADDDHDRSDCSCRGCEEKNMPGRERDSEVMQRNVSGGEGMHRCHKLENESLAMVYSPCQIWRGIYSPDMALRRGTLFKELDKPWEVEGVRGGCYRGK